MAEGLSQGGHSDAEAEGDADKVGLVVYLNISLQVVSACQYSA
jgi:hypothetical protein